jgi:hypothetical protein
MIIREKPGKSIKGRGGKSIEKPPLFANVSG